MGELLTFPSRDNARRLRENQWAEAVADELVKRMPGPKSSNTVIAWANHVEEWRARVPCLTPSLAPWDYLWALFIRRPTDGDAA